MAYFSLTDFYAERDHTIGSGARTGSGALQDYLAARPWSELVSLAASYALEVPAGMTQEALVQELTTTIMATMPPSTP